MIRKSGSNGNRNLKDLLDFSAANLGQSCPRQDPRSGGHAVSLPNDPLGDPIGVREVARLLGCSVWTVRNRLLGRGLPHFRISGNRKLIFYRNQVVLWVLETQNQGGEYQ